jgi:hypothetical protein
VKIIESTLFHCAIALALIQSVKAAVTFSVTPTAVSNTYTGTITLQVGGLTSGETVVIKRYLDVNTNGVIDADDLMVEDFQLTAGQTGAMVIGGVTNVNVPFNWSTDPNAITTTRNFQSGSLAHTLVAQYLFDVSGPSGHITSSFQVTSSYAQRVTGRVVTGTNAVANAVVMLFPALKHAGWPFPGAVADNSGFYTVEAPVGTYSISAFKSNFVSDPSTAVNLVLTNGETLSANLSLIPTTESISGAIADATTGTGLPGVFVLLKAPSIVGFCFTGTNGHFTAGLPAGECGVVANDDAIGALGYVGLGSDVIVSGTNGSVTNVIIPQTRATALFYGRVTDTLGNPLGGVVMECEDDNQTYDSFASTAADGYYVIGVVGSSDTSDGWNVDIANSHPNYAFSQSLYSYLAFDTAVMANFTGMYSGLVLNGGFQTGSFKYWSLTGDTNSISIDDGSVSGIMPYFGRNEAALRTSGSLGYLSQTLSTIAGASYLLSFWFDNPFGDRGEFLVSWNESTLLDTRNPYANEWTNMQFVVSATGTSTVLEFGFEDDRNYFGFDDVTVLPVSPPVGFGSMGVETNQFGFAIAGTGGLVVVVEACTNLANPVWAPLATNTLTTGSAYFSDPQWTNYPGRYYRLRMR